MSCPDDTEIHAFLAGQLAPEEVRRMHAHIDACAGCRDLVTELGREATDGADESAETAGEEETGAAAAKSPFQRYRVKRELGRGGMGVVYLADDTVLHREVALKLIRPDVFGQRDGELAQRFVREARALASIRHPNVVNVFDASLSPEGASIVMEHVEGHTFGRWLSTGPAAWQVVHVTCQVADALATIHRSGLVHRDVKPGNILVDARGTPRLGDFGLVAAPRPQAPSEEGDTRLTRGGVAVGTPPYMAPEQARGGVADARSDQYAFCATLLEGLVGQPIGGPRAAVTLATAASRRRRPPKRLLAVLERGLQTDPRRRFEDMEQLAAALRPFADKAAWKPRTGTRALGCLTAIVLSTAVLMGSGWVLGRLGVPATTDRPATASPIASTMRGRWVRGDRTLAVSAVGLHADEPYTLGDDTRSRTASLRVTSGGPASESSYRVDASDLTTSHGLSDSEGCHGAMELDGDALIVTLTGSSGCDNTLSGAWVRPDQRVTP